MTFRLSLRCLAAIALAAGVACSNDSASPSSQTPAAINPGVAVSRTAPVGTAVAGGLIVKVTDASGNPVQNATVAFAVTQGNGSTSPRVALTDASGNATATWTLGTILGPNKVVATATGVSTQVTFAATGTAGAIASISISPTSARLLATVDTLRITAVSQDSFGNPTSPTPTFVVRDPTLISIDSTGLVRALRRGSATYVVFTAGTSVDSVLVTVLATGQSLCTAAAAPLDLAVGQVVTGLSGQGICVHASSANEEFAVIPYYDSGVPSAAISFQVLGVGLQPVPLASVSSNLFNSRAASVLQQPTVTPDYAFESRLRDRERLEGQARAASARAWYNSRRAGRSPAVASADAAVAPVVVPSVGDLVKLNANANDYCDNAQYRTGRVVAITNKAIVIADTSNPVGGFTDADYQSIGVTFDTLIDPTDRAAFGDVTDIDNNGHVILFFTRAVNELTAAGASSVVLGFFYSRDLLPHTGPPGPCTGSNSAEMFYLLVPDPNGVINSNPRSKASVVSYSNGTVAHEYQHLINASRRLYVNGVGPDYEEKWLDEGLAHVAEELNFFAAAARSPRMNYDVTPFTDPKFAAAYSTFESNNFKRYATYLQSVETQAPIGFDASDDDLPTRGAIWSFLRYAADHLPAGTENSFWFKLVNSTTTGVANLTNALGTAPNSEMRDWAISVYLDDNAANVDPRFQQPSWNMRSALTGGSPSNFPLVTRLLSDEVSTSVTLAGNGVSFLQFSVPTGQDALMTVLSGGQPLPSTVLLALVRVR